MGTNWAKLFFMNNYEKYQGWNQLSDTSDFFIEHWKKNRKEFECAYRGMKKGYFNNFELLEDHDHVINLKSYEDFVKVKYENLNTFYEKLKGRLQGVNIPNKDLKLDDD